MVRISLTSVISPILENFSFRWSSV